MKHFFLLTMLLLPILASAQQMTNAKLKQAGVIVLCDKYVNTKGTEGNMIILRLHDKSRPKHKSNEILIHEVCLTTKLNQTHNVTIDGNLEIDDDGLSIITLNTPDGEANIIIGLDGNNMEFDIYNKYISGIRKYKIESVLFYRTQADIANFNPLGEETDMAKAYKHIKELFKPYY